MSSNIIAFPIDRITAMTPERRLARALTHLAASLQAQRSAVEKWRSAIAILQDANKRLSDDLDPFTSSDAAAVPSSAGSPGQRRTDQGFSSKSGS